MNFKKMIAKRNKSRKTNKLSKSKSSQKGGVGFKLEVGACPIGGRPAVVATSDCPSGHGPGSTDFANAVYGLGGKQDGGSRKRRTRNTKTRKAKCGYKSKKGSGSCGSMKRKSSKSNKRSNRK